MWFNHLDYQTNDLLIFHFNMKNPKKCRFIFANLKHSESLV